MNVHAFSESCFPGVCGRSTSSSRQLWLWRARRRGATSRVGVQACCKSEHISIFVSGVFTQSSYLIGPATLSQTSPP